MNNKISDLFIALSLLAFLAINTPTDASAQGVELGDGVAITAEVVAIDRVDRTLALLGPEGNIVVLEVGHEARNFPQIEIGDMVKAEYYESVALYIGKKGQTPEDAVGLVAARSAEGEKPAAIAVEAVDVSAEVTAINRKDRTVTLELASGEMVTTGVPETVKAFDTLKVGDSIHARYTQAVAISVETS